MIFIKTFTSKANKTYEVYIDNGVKVIKCIVSTCCICYEPSSNKTQCNHIICKDCMTKIDKCAMCRQPLKKDFNKEIFFTYVIDVLGSVFHIHENRMIFIIMNKLYNELVIDYMTHEHHFSQEMMKTLKSYINTLKNIYILFI